MANTMRVRDTRTGKVLRVFAGHLGVDVVNAPIWEDAHTLLLHASGDWVPSEYDEGHFATPRLVRCSVTRTACDIASTTALYGNPVIMQRKSN
jgi:predicted heme/steroid binding protein